MKSLVVGVALTLVLAACGVSAPHMSVGEYVQKIEGDEVNAHMLRDEWIELDGILVEKHVDQSNKLLLSGQNSNTNSLSGASRRSPVDPATGVLVDSRDIKSYTVFCEFSDFGAAKLNRTKTGSRITVRGVLRSWKRSDGELIPSLDTCTVQ